MHYETPLYLLVQAVVNTADSGALNILLHVTEKTKEKSLGKTV